MDFVNSTLLEIGDGPLLPAARHLDLHHFLGLYHFVPGSRFEHVVQLYVFDKKLRLLAMDALERIEMAVRVDIAYLLGQRDPAAHENPSCLHGNFAKRKSASRQSNGKTMHGVWLEKYRGLLHRARREPFIVHHMQTYGRLPIWVAVEIWDFGLLSRFFSGMKRDDQDRVADRYGAPNGIVFSQWLRSLNLIRNVSAHHGRLWNMNVVERSPVPAGWPELNNARPFFYLSLMQQLLSVICPRSTWGDRLSDLLENGFPRFPEGLLSVSDMGLASGWKDGVPWVNRAHK